MAYHPSQLMRKNTKVLKGKSIKAKSITILALSLLYGVDCFAGGGATAVMLGTGTKAATPSPTPADTTAPTLLSAVVDTSGTVLTLVFSEAVTADDWSKASFAMLHYSTAY